TPRTRRPGSTSPTGSTTRTPPWRSSSTSPRQCCRPCTDGRGAGFCGKLLLVFRAETNNRFPQNPQLPAPDTQYGLICFHCPHCLEARQALRSKTGASNQDRYQLSKTATGSISSPSALWSGFRRGNRPRAPILIAPLRRNRDVTNQFYYRVGSVMPVTIRALHHG